MFRTLKFYAFIYKRLQLLGDFVPQAPFTRSGVETSWKHSASSDLERPMAVITRYFAQ